MGGTKFFAPLQDYATGMSGRPHDRDIFAACGSAMGLALRRVVDEVADGLPADALSGGGPAAARAPAALGVGREFGQRAAEAVAGRRVAGQVGHLKRLARRARLVEAVEQQQRAPCFRFVVLRQLESRRLCL